MDNRIRQFRKQREMTLAQLADKVGTTAQSISRLENGRMTLSTDWLAKLADAFHVHPTELLEQPEHKSIAVIGVIDEDGEMQARQGGRIAFADVAADPIAVRLAAAIGRYDAGDVLIADRLDEDDWDRALDRDCLATADGGAPVLCRIIRASTESRVTLVPLAPGVPAVRCSSLSLVAPIVLRISEI